MLLAAAEIVNLFLSVCFWYLEEIKYKSGEKEWMDKDQYLQIICFILGYKDTIHCKYLKLYFPKAFSLKNFITFS